MLCTLIRGQMSYTFFQLGAHVLLCQLLRGQMSSYVIFHRGAHVRGEKCPTLVQLQLIICSLQASLETRLIRVLVAFASNEGSKLACAHAQSPHVRIQRGVGGPDPPPPGKS